MTTTSTDWQSQFCQVYDRGVAAWDAGRQTASTMFKAGDIKFLATIGCTAQELFDFVDDAQNYGEPDYATALAVASIRRDYFLKVLHGQYSGQVASMDDLPSKTDSVDGFAWLPRLMAKAQLKLRGEMPDDLMFGCGGDRAFLDEINMTSPQFLQLAWDSADNTRRIVAEVKRCAGRA